MSKLFLWLLAFHAPGMCASTPFSLRDGDRVVFYGDSITEQRLYTSFTEAFVVTRFPDRKVTFINSGWSGDTVTGGVGGGIDQRIKRDVLVYNPTVVTLLLGMNDGGYKVFDKLLFERFERGYRRILAMLRNEVPATRVTAIQPSAYDDISLPVLVPGGYNIVLQRYGGFVKYEAEITGIDTADFNAPVVTTLKKANQIDPDLARKLIPDRVHPGTGIHWVMAGALLKSWHAPQMVSSVTLNMKDHKVVQSVGATVRDLATLSWFSTESSLPAPIDWQDRAVSLAVNCSSYVDELDREMLTIQGLSIGEWGLRVDDQFVEWFSASELSSGINLAKFQTPMLAQAMLVLRYIQERNHLDFLRWRCTRLPLFENYLSETSLLLGSYLRLEDAILIKQRKAALPVPHRFSLVRKSA